MSAIAPLVTAALFAGAWLYHARTAHGSFPTDWSTYNGGATADHYSLLDQITIANVASMRQVWRFDAGTDGGLQTNPLVVGRVLYNYSPIVENPTFRGSRLKPLRLFDE